MTPEQIANIILLVLTGLLGVGSGSAITLARKSVADRNYQELFQQATEKLVKQQERIDELELQRDRQAIEITAIQARLTLFEEEREKERQRADGYMRNQGRLEANVEQMQRDLTTVRAELETIKAENHKLLEYKVLSEKQRIELDRLAKDLLAEQKTHDLAKRRIEQLENLVDKLSKPEPEPPTPKIVPKASGE